MTFGIKSIFLDDKHGKNTSIVLNGKNLIVCGNNGSGKTRFLNRIFDTLKSYSRGPVTTNYDYYFERLSGLLGKMFTLDSDHIEYESVKNDIALTKEKLAEANAFRLEFLNLSSFSKYVIDGNAYIRFFNATRKANIVNDGRLTSLEMLRSEYLNYSKSDIDFVFDSAAYFERYLVSMWNYALLKKAVGDSSDFINISNKIKTVTDDLRRLFEDDSLELDFNFEELTMYVNQEGKEPYRLSQLSSGFSSILAIYSDLFMRSEINHIPKNKMKGIVIIDEIDVHLHVTLQKIVFPFFSDSYKNMQFIVSTHSPFVIQSVTDSVIFNLSTHEQLENLSLYSYTSVIKGLLGEDSISSKLSSLINEMNELVSRGVFNQRLSDIIVMLDENYNNLDVKVLASIEMIRNKMLDHQQGADYV